MEPTQQETELINKLIGELTKIREMFPGAIALACQLRASCRDQIMGAMDEVDSAIESFKPKTEEEEFNDTPAP